MGEFKSIKIRLGEARGFIIKIPPETK